MQYVNIHDAKTNLSKYLEQLVNSPQDTIVICKNGVPIAQLTPYSKTIDRKLGLWKGKIYIDKDFDKLPREFKDYFE